MRSFTLSALATLAFGIFCSAAPTPGGLPSVAVAARDTPAPVEADQTLVAVLTTASSSLNPLVEQVANLHTVGAVGDAVEDLVLPILQNALGIVQCAVAGVQKLQGLPIEEVLYDVELSVVLDVAGIVNIVYPVVQLVVTILANVLTLVDGRVLPLVVAILASLVELLTGVLGLVGDFAAQVIILLAQEIQGLIPAILTLGGTNLLALLQISQ